MREFGVRPQEAQKPRLVLVDLDHWDAFASFAPSVRRRGMSVARISPSRTGRGRALARVVDRLVFGAAGSSVDVDTSAQVALSGLLGAPTVDVLGAEDVVESLRDSMSWSPHPVAARVPREDHVRLLFDKLEMTRFAARIPVPVPRSWSQAPDGVLPMVVKGRSGAGGKAVWIAQTSAEVFSAVRESAARAPRGVFFQELVDGVLTNVGGVADRGRIVTAGCYRPYAAAATPLGPPETIEIVRSPGIEASLPPLLEALSYSGPFCIDYIERPDGSASLIDFNPRIFGGWLAMQTAGIDLLGAYLSLFGLAAPPPPSEPVVGSRYDVRLLPAVGAGTREELASRLWHSAKQLRRVAPVTGSQFIASMGLRWLRTATHDAVALTRRA